MIGGGVGFIVGLVLILVAVGQNDGSVLLIVGGLVALFGGATFVGGVMETSRYHRTHCQACGHLLDVEDTTYLGMSVRDRGGNTYSGTDRKEEVQFDCKCPNCGRESSFSKSFTTGSVDKNGNVKTENLESLIKRYWKYKK